MVDSLGCAYSLSTHSRSTTGWQLRDNYAGIGKLQLKRLSAGHGSVWGVGYDHHVYVFVHSSDIPIRNIEEAYENQVGKLVNHASTLGSM